MIASYPASDPNVTPTGGTNPFVNSSEDHSSGTAWNDADPATCSFKCTQGVSGATGAAPSTLWPTPSHQQGLVPGGSHGRWTSDVSLNASGDTATMICLGLLGDSANGLYFFGGTSEASPIGAATTADLDQAVGGNLGAMNPVPYHLASGATTHAEVFPGATVGTNSFPTSTSPGFRAGTRWDPLTGPGTPNEASLIATLAPVRPRGVRRSTEVDDGPCDIFSFWHMMSP